VVLAGEVREVEHRPCACRRLHREKGVARARSQRHLGAMHRRAWRRRNRDSPRSGVRSRVASFHRGTSTDRPRRSQVHTRALYVHAAPRRLSLGGLSPPRPSLVDSMSPSTAAGAGGRPNAVR
jgi:hypothetical protein